MPQDRETIGLLEELLSGHDTLLLADAALASEVKEARESARREKEGPPKQGPARGWMRSRQQ
jgi:hypothetical protein